MFLHWNDVGKEVWKVHSGIETIPGLNSFSLFVSEENCQVLWVTMQIIWIAIWFHINFWAEYCLIYLFITCSSSNRVFNLACQVFTSHSMKRDAALHRICHPRENLIESRQQTLGGSFLKWPCPLEMAIMLMGPRTVELSIIFNCSIPVAFVAFDGRIWKSCRPRVLSKWFSSHKLKHTAVYKQL